MCKQLEKIELNGQVKGFIWWPQIECTKDFYRRYTPEDKPFSDKWNGIRAALLDITNDGDFQSCNITYLGGIVTWRDGKRHISQQLDFNPLSKAFNDLVCSEEWEYILPEEEYNTSEEE